MEADRIAAEIADLARASGRSVGLAESLTGGQAAAALAAAPDAVTWFRGSVVAYAAEVKQSVLGVEPGPVITETCARAMAMGARTLLGADVAAAVTGVGGPDDEEGHPPGTVFVACSASDGCFRHEAPKLGGTPEEIVAGSVRAVLALVRDELRRSARPH